MKRIRTFVAVDLNDHVRRNAAKLVQQLAAALPPTVPIHWVNEPLMHVTVKFLGEVEESELVHVCRGVASACRGISAAELECGGLGVFPRATRPRTIWLALHGAGCETLHAMQSQVEAAMAELGFPRERRRFEPHVTLGRIRGKVDFPTLSQLLNQYADFQAGRFALEEVTIYASRLARGGPAYMPLGRVELEGGE